MATELGKAYVQIVPSAQGISGSISSVLEGESVSAGKKSGATLTSNIKKVLKTAGIGMALKKTITEGANLQQAVGGIETMFGDSADKMKEYAANAYKNAGISANTYMEQATSFSASLLQSVGGDTVRAAETANQAINDMGDNANKFGTNIQDIQNAYQGFAKQNYTMLDNLKLGYGGTKTEMERLLANAEEISGIHYDISNLDDVYNAIHVIQDELGVTGTTGDEAVKTLSGSFGMLKASASNFLAALTLDGTEESIQSVSDATSDLVNSASTMLFGNLLPAVGRVGSALPGAIATGIKTALPEIGKNGAEIITSLTAAIETKVPELIKTAPIIFDKFLNGLTSNGPSILAKAGELLVNLGSAFISNIPTLLLSASQIIKNFTQYLVNNGPQLFAGAGQLVGQLTLGIIKNLPKLVYGLVKLGASILSFLGTLPGMAWSAAKKFIAGIVKGLILTPVKAKMEAVKNALTTPIQKAKDVIKGIVDKIKGLFNFKVSMPKIKLPHFSISPKGWKVGDLLKGSIPKLGINWYKSGGVFSDPSVIGVGEAGQEAVVPLDKLWEQMDKHSGTIDYTMLANALVSALSQVNLTSTTNIDGKVVAETTAPLIRKQINKLDSRNNRKLGYI